MTPEREEALLGFVTDVSRRLHAGEHTYQDKSFDAEPAALLREIREELVDVSAWAFILTERLRGLESALAAMPASGPIVVIRRPGRQPDPTPENASTGQPGASNGQSAVSMDKALESGKGRPS